VSDVSSILGDAKNYIERGCYELAIGAIEQAEKAWQIEVDAWSIELALAEREINSSRLDPWWEVKQPERRECFKCGEMRSKGVVKELPEGTWRRPRFFCSECWEKLS